MGAAGTSLHLTRGRLLARNTIWNLLGQLLPMAVGVVVVPPLVRGLGVTRFGILSLAWIVIGYFSLFDLGIGRALTKQVADKLAANEEASIPPLVWTSLLLLLLVGILGTLAALGFTPWLIHRALRVPTELQAETLRSFYLLAVSIALVTVTSGLRGILEAQQRFGILTLIRIPLSVFSFVGPLLVLPFSHSLVPVVLVLIGGRLVACLAHLLACFYAMPGLRQVSFEGSVIRPVFSFGGWIAIISLVAPMMVYVDRFIVSALLSVAMVAYYTAPFDVLLRLSVISGGVAGVLFPAFAVSVAQDRERTGLLISRAVKYIFLALFPVVLVIVTLAPEGLRLWLGPAFAQNGTAVTRWLAAGLLVNAVATVPFILLQSAGKPGLVAMMQSVELPVYIVAVGLWTYRFGIVGTAIAWSARVTLDAILLFWFADRLLPHKPRFQLKLWSAMAVAMAWLGLALVFDSLPAKAVFLAASLVIFTIGVWRWGLEPSERFFLLGASRQEPVRLPTN